MLSQPTNLPKVPLCCWKSLKSLEELRFPARNPLSAAGTITPPAQGAPTQELAPGGLHKGGLAASPFIRARFPLCFFYPRNHPEAILAVFKQAQVAGPALQGFGSCQPAKTRWEALALPRCGLQKINNKYFFLKQNNQTGTLPSSLREQGKREQLGQPRRTDTKGKPRGKELFFPCRRVF